MSQIALILSVPACLVGGIWLGFRFKNRNNQDVLVAFLGSIILPSALVWSANSDKCVPSADDPCDAGPMVFVGSIVLFPVVWLIGFAIAGFGIAIGRYAHPETRRNKEMIKLDL